jgi:hypothetical protein
METWDLAHEPAGAMLGARRRIGCVLGVFILRAQPRTGPVGLPPVGPFFGTTMQRLSLRRRVVMNTTKNSAPVAKVMRLKIWFRFIFAPRRLSSLHHAAMNRTMKKPARIFRDGAHNVLSLLHALAAASKGRRARQTAASPQSYSRQARWRRYAAARDRHPHLRPCGQRGDRKRGD